MSSSVLSILNEYKIWRPGMDTGSPVSILVTDAEPSKSFPGMVARILWPAGTTDEPTGTSRARHQYRPMGMDHTGAPGKRAHL